MSTLPLPVKLENLSPDEMSHIWSLGLLGNSKLVRTNPGALHLSVLYSHLNSKHYNFEFRKDDIMILSYPKSGTTWAAELVWSLVHPSKVPEFGNTHISDRVYYIDQDFVLPAMENSSLMAKLRKMNPVAKWIDGVVLQLAEAEKDRRILWSHMPLNLLNPNMMNTCKCVYIARNPKDVCVSYYHFLMSIEGSKGRAFQGEFEDWVNLFVRGKYMTYGPYFDHLRQIWTMKNCPNIYIIFYEDLKNDLMMEIKKLANFLQLDIKEELMKNAGDHASFKEMQMREAKNGPVFKECQTNFYRKGQVGDWNNLATTHLEQYVTSWISENAANLDIDFKYK